jgi:hypothetical protein
MTLARAAEACRRTLVEYATQYHKIRFPVGRPQGVVDRLAVQTHGQAGGRAARLALTL